MKRRDMANSSMEDGSHDPLLVSYRHLVRYGSDVAVPVLLGNGSQPSCRVLQRSSSAVVLPSLSLEWRGPALTYVRCCAATGRSGLPVDSAECPFYCSGSAVRHSDGLARVAGTGDLASRQIAILTDPARTTYAGRNGPCLLPPSSPQPEHACPDSQRALAPGRRQRQPPRQGDSGPEEPDARPGAGRVAGRR
jgi:hypothetical protein